MFLPVVIIGYLVAVGNASSAFFPEDYDDYDFPRIEVSKREAETKVEKESNSTTDEVLESWWRTVNSNDPGVKEADGTDGEKDGETDTPTFRWRHRQNPLHLSPVPREPLSHHPVQHGPPTHVSVPMQTICVLMPVSPDADEQEYVARLNAVYPVVDDYISRDRTSPMRNRRFIPRIG